MTTGSLTSVEASPSKIVMFGDFTFTDTRYYSDINGNTASTSPSNSYGNNVKNDYTTSITPSVYAYDEYNSENENVYLVSQTNTSSTSGTLTQNIVIPTNGPAIEYCQSVRYANYNINMSSNNNSPKITIFMNYSYYYYTYYWVVWPFYEETEKHNLTIMSINLSTNSNQKINYSVKASTTLLASTLGSAWSKVSDRNGNRPYITNFYW